MRKLVYLLAIGVLAIASCKKSDFIGNGCITQTRRNFGVSASDSIAAANLLKANGIANADLVYDKVLLHDTVTNVNDHITSVYQHIDAIQYFNGLPLFNNYIGYHFKGGAYYTTIGTRYDKVNLSTSHKLDLQKVRLLYLAADGSAKRMKDSCLVAEFGYYDLNHGTGGLPPNIVKAWHVTPANTTYPEAFFRDDNNATISYFDGIYTL